MAPPKPGRLHDPFRFDRGLLREAGAGSRYLAGVDEVGRGCLAGPLVCAAVILDYRTSPDRTLAGLRDSKLLTPSRREDLYERILRSCVRWAVVHVSASSLDGRGLHRSNLAALGDALLELGYAYDLAVVDGFDLGRPELHCRALVEGDRLSAAVAAASVVAKVTRDRLMRAVHEFYPVYGFDRHVGYATEQHRAALAAAGACPLHRRS